MAERRATRIEVEAKFAIPDQPAFERLMAAETLAGFVMGPRTVREVTDHYLDTQDWTLLAAGYACRVRERDNTRVLTLKSFGETTEAIKQRAEHEAVLDPAVPLADATLWPAGSARTLVGEAIGDRPLEIRLTLQQIRHAYPLLDGDRPVVELSLDKVFFGQHEPVYELEVELLPTGAIAELEQIIKVLEDKWTLLSVSLSKFEQGLQMQAGDALPAAPEGEGTEGPPMQPQRADMHADDPMSEAGRGILGLHFERMLAHETGTRLGENVEELHDMRVATRRMRAAFQVFAPYFEAKAVKPYLKGLKRTGRALGPVRDLDVFEEKARRYLATLPADQADALDELLSDWGAERVSARQRMLAYLDSERHSRFVERFGQFLSTSGAGVIPRPVNGTASFRVRHIAPQLLYSRYEAVRAYEPLLDSAPIDLLHALRIDFKRLRYVLEFFLPVLGPEAKMMIGEVKQMQDHLGDLNDADVAVQLLQGFLGGAQQGHEGVRAYLRDREHERTRLLECFPAAWARFTRPEVRRHLALAVAVL
jgi:CHAD domain-containing protein/uncharacterized protein YjbK